jgi:hypothetical protein
MEDPMLESDLTPYLVENFEQCLNDFETLNPFSRPEQYETHARTMDLRMQLGSASRALADDRFLSSLRGTLQAWDMDKRAARLVQTEDFIAAMRKRSLEIEALDKLPLTAAKEKDIDTLWRLIRSLQITQNQSKLVASAKALHHLLPELVVPIDRNYTAPFLGREQPNHFQNPVQEERTFRLAFGSFVAISRGADPGKYVGRYRWNTSATKVIDNAIVGLIARVQKRVREKLRAR